MLSGCWIALNAMCWFFLALLDWRHQELFWWGSGTFCGITLGDYLCHPLICLGGYPGILKVKELSPTRTCEQLCFWGFALMLCTIILIGWLLVESGIKWSSFKGVSWRSPVWSFGILSVSGQNMLQMKEMITEGSSSSISECPGHHLFLIHGLY